MLILVSNPDGIGDTLLRQPLYAALREAGHRLVLLVRPDSREAAALVAPGVPLLEIPVDPYSVVEPQDAPRLAPLLSELRALRPDLLVLAPYQRTHFDEWLSGALAGTPVAGMSGGVYPCAVEAAQRQAVPIAFSSRADVEAREHEWEKNRRLCAAILGRTAAWPRPRVQATDAQRSAASALLAAPEWRGEGFWLAGVGHAPSRDLRNWPLERWVATLSHGARHHGLRYALAGIPDERDANEQVRMGLLAAGVPAERLRLVEPGFEVFVGLAALSSGYVGRDTGSMHLAAALGKPVLAVFGGGHWPQFTPVAERCRVLTLAVPCRGCGWICHLRQSHCIKQVPVESVIAAFDELAGGATDGRIDELPRSLALAEQMEREAALAAREHIWLLTHRQRQLDDLSAANARLAAEPRGFFGRLRTSSRES